MTGVVDEALPSASTAGMAVARTGGEVGGESGMLEVGVL